MLSKWSWIVFNFIIYASTAPQNEAHAKIKAFLELIELDYEDICHNTADAQWSFIISPSNKTLLIWVGILSKLNPLNCILFFP